IESANPATATAALSRRLDRGLSVPERTLASTSHHRRCDEWSAETHTPAGRVATGWIATTGPRIDQTTAVAPRQRDAALPTLGHVVIGVGGPPRAMPISSAAQSIELAVPQR